MELLIDAETDLILSERLLDPRGEVRLTSEFESITYGDVEPLPDGIEPLETSGAASPAAAPLRLGFVPKGFRQVRSVREGEAAREYWSDGLASFVLRQEPVLQAHGGDGAEAGPGGEVPAEGVLERRESQGRLSYSGVLAGRRVLVEGYLAADQLEAVARGLRDVR
jgi:hypothetical protein